jgi:hypothetical protein
MWAAWTSIDIHWPMLVDCWIEVCSKAAIVIFVRNSDVAMTDQGIDVEI